MMATEMDRRAAEQALQALADARGGRLTAEMVVEAARDPDSPLHGFFTWDDATAAEQHRMMEARALIRSVRVVFRVENREVRAPYFVRDPEMAHRQQGYVALARLRTDEDAARAVAVREFAMASSALERARAVASVLQVQEEIADVQDRVNVLRARLSADTSDDRRGTA